jgi:Glycosyl hydrolase family 26
MPLTRRSPYSGFAYPVSERVKDLLLSPRGMASAALVVVAVAAAAVLLLRGGGETPPPVHVPPSTAPPTTPAPVGGGTLFGASVRPETNTVAAEKAAVIALEGVLGRSLDINHNFYAWDEDFPTEIERWDLRSGRLPMISWNGKGVLSSDVADGKYDALINDRAARVKALGGKVLIRWMWEMDGNKKAEFVRSPPHYIDAWRHIVTSFRDRGATNVEWVWCPNASAFIDGEAQSYYPGDDYVDWVCADGYNWAPGRPGDEWRSFKDIFSAYYSWATSQKKQIMVGEFGVQERTGDDKARWVEEARQAIKTDFPRIGAIVYFDADQDFDWRMNTSESALRAFRDMATDPWFDVNAKVRLPR